MTRRKRTGPAGKREPRDSGVALFNEGGEWIGKFDLTTSSITTVNGTISSIGTKAHKERAVAALAWLAANRPDLLAEIVGEDEVVEAPEPEQKEES